MLVVVDLAAAHDPGQAAGHANGIHLRPHGIRAVPVQAPLRHVVGHPKETGAPRRVRCPRFCVRSAAPGSIQATGMFPFRLGGQAVRFALLLREPATKRVGVVPTDPRDGIAPRSAADLAAMLGPELTELWKRHLGFTEQEGPPDRDLAHRLFIPMAV